MQETWVWSLGWEDPLEKGMQPTPVFLPGESPWLEEPGGLQSMQLQRVRHDWGTKHWAKSLSAVKKKKKKNWYLIFGQKGGKLYLLLLNFLQLKIIFMSKRHALRWHILISFSGFRFWERNENANNLFRVTNAEAKNTEPVSCLKRTWSKEMDSQESCYQIWVLEYRLPFD